MAPYASRYCWALAVLLTVLASLPTGSAYSEGGAQSATIEVYFGPEDLPGDRLVALYRQAKRYVYVAVYGLTYPPAVKALVSAKKRGVDVRVITDRDRLTDPKQAAAVRTLHLAGIPIRVNQHDGLMHLKQVVVDGVVNVSGSMNHTTSGNEYNDERMDVIRDSTTTAKAHEKFVRMWNDDKRYAPWK